MADKRGKQFELKLKEDFARSLPNSTIDRIYDTVNGLYGVSNISDFIGFKQPNIFYLEAKTIKGKTFPFSNLTQYEKLCKKVGIPGVRAGAVIWYYDIDRVIYVPIKTVTAIKKSGKKSLNIETIDRTKFRIIDIPSIKKRVFMDSDYSVLMNLEDGD